ncbi:MAG TPA: PEP-CTERM sorting domain-containing protein [Ideonella sp.]|uniref:PEP-CTERM sorting domain-containing protein n=1 Tax=Ideonella sp. TaxID=1929293 RepID=UPI002E2FE4E3|nr:PEP-CTERM sorting domain-containing protein [Ideonella sp.]HEX5684230.1 PEP-CTERM sorting domain-containing protein [Ideonella sp.]
MNLMSWAAALIVLTSGQAFASPQPHREMRDDYWVTTQYRGVPAVYLGSSGSEWAQRVDFASASGTALPVTWSPTLPRTEFGGLPPAVLQLPHDDPLGPAPRPGDTGTALAGNIVAEDRLAHLGEVLAVPEPSALLMMVAGIGAIAFVIRRRINDT